MRLLCALSLALTVLAPSAALAQGTIYLVRHAEKESVGKDPALTDAGQARARNIAATLRKVGVAQIYSTALMRTQMTAKPLATLLAVPVRTYDPSRQAEFATQLKALPGNTLVVGHSNTLTELVRLLGGEPGADIADTEYDRLYQLAIDKDGSVTTVLMHSIPGAPPAP
ncbi:phosphoglycerate mutase family protein [Massilia glaciei]|nr:phosphoglycerate mutase family protein [Massilia glaciei]